MAIGLLGGKRAARVVAAAVFLCGAVVLPALHQAFHRLDHTHAGGGIRFQAEARPPEPHRHAGGRWHTHAPVSHDHRPAPDRDPKPAERDHGEGSLAHQAFALGEAASVPVPQGSVQLSGVPVAALADDQTLRPGFLRPDSARGPPVL
jgi:hypothetical protein